MSKKLARILNHTARKNLPLNLQPAATRTSCPYEDCQRGLIVGKALNNGVEWGEHHDDDFTCPFCRRTLILSKPLFGNLYFVRGDRRPNYSQ